MRPTAIEPEMKPMSMTATIELRRRSGEYSAVSEIAFAIAPPTPSPVKKRKPFSIATDVLAALAMLQMPNNATQASSTGRRPTRSASGATKSPPNIKPISPDEKNRPSSEGDRPKSRINAGAT
jgi:hypothetical protein